MPKRTEDNIHVGSRFKNNQGDWFTIIHIINMRNITISFDYDTENTHVKSKYHILAGKVVNKNKPSLAGVGFIGYGQYSSVNQKEAYATWCNMIIRCYDKSYRDYHSYGGRGVYVVKAWHNFQTFCKWFLCNNKHGLELDKDLKCSLPSYYSPETCLFLPHKVNGLFITRRSKSSAYGMGVHINRQGKFASNITHERKVTYLGCFNTPEEAFKIYKKAKEDIVKMVANEFKGRITEEAYDLLMTWEAKRFPQ